MKMKFDDIKKENRRYFKDELSKAISGKIKVSFLHDTATVEIIEGEYIIDEEALTLKSKTKKEVRQFIEHFRMYQFNVA